MSNHPTPDVLSEIDQLCCAIGHIVVQWGFVEFNIDMCVAIIYHKYGGNNITDKIPKFIQRKKDFLRNSFNQLSSLTKFKQQGIALMDRVAMLAKERDDIIHSAYAGFSSDTFDFNKLNLDKSKTMHVVQSFKYTIPAVLETRKKIEVLATDIGHYCFGILEHLGIKIE